MDVALDGSVLQIALHGPGHNFVGFEHQARTEEEVQSLKAAEAALNDAASLFGLPSAAVCELSGANVLLPEADLQDDTQKFAAQSPNHEHADDPRHRHGHAQDQVHHRGHEHQNDHEHAEYSHSDWLAEYTFTCARSASLNQIDVQVFAAFPQTQEIRFQLAAPTSQSGGVLNSANTAITIPRT